MNLYWSVLEAFMWVGVAVSIVLTIAACWMLSPSGQRWADKHFWRGGSK